MLRKSILLFFLSALLFITACNSRQISISTQPPTMLVIPSVTNTAMPTNSPMLVSSPMPQPTVELLPVSVSPDKNWKIMGFTEWDIQAIASQDGKTRWELKNELKNYSWYDWGYAFYRWSAQSNIIYLTLHPYVDGFIPFYQGSGLIRFDLTNGTITEILSGQGPNLSSFSLSPDEKSLAYESYSDGLLSLMIRNIEMGTEIQIPLDGYDFAGGIVWSPQQDRMVFSVATGHDWADLRVSMLMLNLWDLSKTILYTVEQQRLTPKEFLNENEILVSSGEISYIFNLTTKELIEYAPSTPSP